VSGEPESKPKSLKIDLGSLFTNPRRWLKEMENYDETVGAGKPLRDPDKTDGEILKEI
jgi:hypothetical protein